MKLARWAVPGLLAALSLGGVGGASGAAVSPLGLSDCAPAQGVYQCSGLVASWDGVPLDTTVTLPSSSPGSRLPLVVELNGFGNSKYEYLDPSSTAYTDNAFDWAKAGYAVLTYTARGLWGSCGTPAARAAQPAACARGYIHLADVRYEARDAQELIGRLVDEGVADAGRIGVTGDSYGGGQSFELAALRNRVMLPDGTLVSWRSPAGVPLSLAAAAPVIPWTDLVYAIAPNGRTSTLAVPAPGADTSPVGVFKASFANAIFAAAQAATGPGQPVGQPFVPGQPEGYLAPPGVDPSADVTTWVARSDQGEPYTDPQAQAIVADLEAHHAAYYIDPSVAPPPLLVGAGFTDDLFPVDETLRFVNRTRREHPATPISLQFGDFGHQRAANKAPDHARLISAIHAWFDHYLRGQGPAPPADVTATTQTCPRTALPEGPFTAPTFAALARGEVRFDSNTAQTISSTGGDPTVERAIDPVAGGGDDCAQTSAGPESGTATYSLPPAPRGGYTLLGAPLVVAQLHTSGDPTVQQVAARLWDVSPGGASQTLVARGLYRPTGAATDVFQLHANGWRFAAGHVARLELLGRDAPYARPSNQPFQITVTRLALRLPVREVPDCAVVMPTAAPLIPPGQTLAPGVSPDAAPGCGRGSAQVQVVRRCVSRRRFRIRAVAHGRALRAARVYVDGRRVRVRHGRHPAAVVDLRGFPRGVVAVTLSGRTRSGRKVVLRRRYRTCTKRAKRSR